jgi:hypothetical protein
VLGTIADWYRRLYVEAFAGALSYERIANNIGADPRDVRSSVSHLIGLCLVGVERGSGGGRTPICPPCPGASPHRCRPRSPTICRRSSATAGDHDSDRNRIHRRSRDGHVRAHGLKLPEQLRRRSHVRKALAKAKEQKTTASKSGMASFVFNQSGSTARHAELHLKPDGKIGGSRPVDRYVSQRETEMSP